MKTAAKWLFIICLPVLLLSASIGLTVNSLWLYEYGAREYGVSQDLARAGLELSEAEIDRVYEELVGYFNSGEDYLSITVVKDGEPFPLFTGEEAIHFRDVKGLIRLDYWLLAGTLLYATAYAVACLWRRDRRRLAQATAGGGSLTLALLVLLVLLNTLLGFGEIFYRFHLMFFTNDFWFAEGYMLRLFPTGFFLDAVTFGAGVTAGLAILLGGAGWLCLILREKGADPADLKTP